MAADGGKDDDEDFIEGCVSTFWSCYFIATLADLPLTLRTATLP